VRAWGSLNMSNRIKDFQRSAVFPPPRDRSKALFRSSPSNMKRLRNTICGMRYDENAENHQRIPTLVSIHCELLLVLLAHTHGIIPPDGA